MNGLSFGLMDSFICIYVLRKNINGLKYLSDNQIREGALQKKFPR